MLARRKRLPQDTAEGCLALAEADLVRAAESVSIMGRKRFEDSAAAWASRAAAIRDRTSSVEQGVTLRPTDPGT